MTSIMTPLFSKLRQKMSHKSTTTPDEETLNNSAESKVLDDSQGDPQFFSGKCKVARCKEKVWAPCKICLSLVCYDQCIEDIKSCEQH